MARTRIGFRLSEEQKARWEEHVEESRYYDTLSDFVKLAARQQIERDTGEAEPAEATSSTGSAPSGEMLDKIESLQGDIRGMEEAVTQAVGAIRAQDGLDPELQPAIVDNLPQQEEKALTTAEIAKMLGEDRATIRFILELMRDRTGIINKEVPTETNTTETESGSAIAQKEGVARWWRGE